MKLSAELKIETLQKLPDKTLIYIFYNYQNKEFKMEATRLLYARGWSYNYQDCLWYFKLDLKNLKDAQYFNPKKWEVVPCEKPPSYEAFVTFEDFEKYLKIKTNQPAAKSPSRNTSI